MSELGLCLSSEEHSPTSLWDQARSAEEAGLQSPLISDHYHPWTDRLGDRPRRGRRAVTALTVGAEPQAAARARGGVAGSQTVLPNRASSLRSPGRAAGNLLPTTVSGRWTRPVTWFDLPVPAEGRRSRPWPLDADRFD